MTSHSPPPLQVARWFNTAAPISLDDLRGRVVVLHAFQMLCPGCVKHGLPQAMAIRRAFGEDEVAVIGLHSVFEHHAVMKPAALEVFLAEYRVNFPVGVDSPAESGDIPLTMAAYEMRGTPTLVLIDRAGVLRLHHFGQADDLLVGAAIGRLLGEPPLPS
jgi:peroxiredoxin